MTKNLVPDSEFDQLVQVAPGIVAAHYADPKMAYTSSRGWAIRHACPGLVISERIVSAPLIASDLISTDPLHFEPSILCLGGGGTCNLHGFIRDGKWHDAGTPAETMAYVVG